MRTLKEVMADMDGDPYVKHSEIIYVMQFDEEFDLLLQRNMERRDVQLDLSGSGNGVSRLEHFDSKTKDLASLFKLIKQPA